MTDHLDLCPHNVIREDRPDGSILLRAGNPLPGYPDAIGAWLDHWAQAAPDRVFLAERDGPGWREITYAATLTEVRRIAAGLLDLGLGPERPILIMSGNSLSHGLLAMAAQYVGIPYAPVAEQYALIPGAHERLKYAIDLINPALIYAEDGETYAAALALPAVAQRQILCARNEPTGALSWAALRGTGDVAAARSSVSRDTVAKYLLTSGSTSDPKAVVTTHGMLTCNQAMLAAGLPFVKSRPPVLVDWLPWNHTFGGSHNFNLVLSQGGSLYIDDGKPLPALFPRTVENLGKVSGTISFNVPVGFAQLVEALRADPELARMYFQDLDMIFYAGASLPQETWLALEDLARASGGRIPLITSSWGLTETAPGALLQQVPAKGAGIVGVPLPGLDVKLIPDDDGRMDVRVRGDSIFPRYLNNAKKTAEAFDEEGFFVSGDAMRFVDPDDMSKGLRFDGRMSEDFKLQTGIWVQAGNLRLEVLPLLAPFAQDVVIVGDGRTEVGLMILPNRAACERAGYVLEDSQDVCLSASLQRELARRLAPVAKTSRSSSMRITRALVLSAPPSMGAGKITAKGNLNFPKLLSRRAASVERLYRDDDDALILPSESP